MTDKERIAELEAGVKELYEQYHAKVLNLEAKLRALTEWPGDGKVWEAANCLHAHADDCECRAVLASALRAKQEELANARRGLDLRDAKIERMKSSVHRIAEDRERFKSRVRLLEASVILADAGIDVAKAGLIKENEVLLPYLEMKSRAESAEKALAAMTRELEDARRIGEAWRRELAAAQERIKTLEGR